MKDPCEIGMIGLGVMGRNLALNMADHGFRVAVWNREPAATRELVEGEARGKPIVCRASLEDLVRALARPRRIMIMITAGAAVDSVIGELAPLLEPGDVLIDGGNSYFEDTERRVEETGRRGLLFVGAGVSGGEEGARHGPSIMPGGRPEAWPRVREILQGIAAKVGPERNIPCCDWVGPFGAGHYVKMVHNGIEYGDMQLICEAYGLLRDGLGLGADELAGVFAAWNRTELDSYLIEITRDIFSVRDPESGMALVDLVLDAAGQKGTGRWTSKLALDLGVPTTLITEAVFARALSSQKRRRLRASELLSGPRAELERFRREADRAAFVEKVRRALYASKICSYAQGFVQLRAASAERGWELRPGDLAMLWRGGCIIRAAFLEDIKAAFDRDGQLDNLLLDPRFRDAVEAHQGAWREVVATAVRIGVWTPAFAAALCYFDGYRSARLPHNLLQAQRDCFGSHGYERTDRPGTFHTDWLRLRREPPD
jgi:6-phosphogluconate dehydrogenase